MASSGLLTTIMIAFGDPFTTFPVTCPTIAMLVARRSSRLIPGLRGIPDVITTTSELRVGPYPFVPMTFASTLTTGLASYRSSALPCGIPLTMSTSTMSAYPRSAKRCAVVAPTLPAPIMVTLLRNSNPPLIRPAAAVACRQADALPPYR